MQTEPLVPYVYQPGRPLNGVPADRQRIWAVGGPGTEALAGERFTRAEAEKLVDDLVLAGVGMLDAFLPKKR